MTWKLSRRSKNELLHVHPDLGQFVACLLLESPVDFGVHDGLREQAEQRQLVDLGASRTMNSRHLRGADGYGHAVDLVPYFNGKLRWEWELIYPLAEAARKVSLQIEVPIRWGGVWDRRLGNLRQGFMGAEVRDYVARLKARWPDKKVFIDGPHFELPRIKAYR
jgi:peptidoglycan L-alanyl-D-glutamate endopeptidase CwlK